MDNYDKRLTEAEWQITLHAKELKSLKHTSRVLEEGLTTIQTTLNQIKWITVGAVLSFLVGELGVLESLRILIGS